MKALPQGQYVRHGVYGLGFVTESDVERTTIDFDDHGMKKFVTSMMVVELAGDAPKYVPSSRRRKRTAAAAAKRLAASS